MEEPKYILETKPIEYSRIFLLSDLHFGVRANSLEWLNNQMEFFEKFYIPFLEKNRQQNDVLFFFRGLF